MLIVNGELSRDQGNSEVPSSTDVSTVGLLLQNGGPGGTQGAPRGPPAYSPCPWDKVIKDGPPSGEGSNEDQTGNERF